MREILFRGERTDNGKWVYGSLLKLSYPEMKSMRTFIITENVAVDMTDREIIGNDESIFEVIPKTVGQYTGVKDKNGEKIFEGDFVTFHTEYEMDNDDVWYEKEPYLVRWDNEIAGFEPFYLNGRWRCDIVNLKIVRNKWDNPELLEE